MAIAITPGRQFDYVLQSDRMFSDGQPNPCPTRWKLRALTMREAMEIEDGSAYADAESKRIHARNGWAVYRTLKAGLVGVEGFVDDDGTVVEWDGEPDNRKHPTRMIVSDAFLDRIRSEDRIELARAIIDRNTVTEDERGN